MRDKRGNIVGVFGLFWDITERKQMQDKLYKSQQMFETMVNGITDAVLLLSPDLKILWANSVCPAQFGLTMEQILGQHCYNITHKQLKRCQAADHKCPIKEAMKTGNAETCLHTHTDKNGEVSFVEVTAFPIKDKAGEIMQFLYLQRDITERKRAEDESKRIEDLKTSTEMKLHFTSMVSHELRSPLVAIKEGINLVLEGLAGNINVEQKDLLNTAKRNVDRLSRLINNVLDFQRLDLGKLKFDIRHNDIKELALEVSNTMSIAAKQKGLNLAVEIDDNLPRIEFDRDRITQVLTNLVDNAIRYTEKGKIIISVKQETNVLHVMVQDAGPGIKSEDMDKVFLAFEQLDSAKGKNKGGTGLGLAISKEIILGHNGKIWVESGIGKGSVFHFTLPIK
jgi:PAS domain S-box-containing protein